MSIDLLATLLFALAVLHTFLVGPIRAWSHRFPHDSIPERTLHLLGEVEVVFGLWASLFLLLFGIFAGTSQAVGYLESLQFTEPLFVFVIMTVASTRPVLEAARSLIIVISKFLNKVTGLPEITVEMFVVLSVGPLAGSFITEPAAITVTAILLASMAHTHSKRVLYFMLAVLLVNISVGGALTPYAAPPILMIASAWGWDLSYTLTHLGWKAALVVVTNAFLFCVFFRKEFAGGFYTLKHLSKKSEGDQVHVPWYVTLTHLVFLAAIVVAAHHEPVFLGIFLLFLGVTSVFKKYQSPLRMKEALLVAFFLGGIIVFGRFQSWWLKPILTSMGDFALFLGATGLTAITDNAALTYLGSQVEGLSEASRYALVAGALAGGGLTVIANAPNPAGFSILQGKFPDGQIKPLGLLGAALIPTLIAMLYLWFLPDLAPL